ncbi:MAG: phosphate ABC transporter permease subunit PstC [Rhodospirillaceae bacterium]|nr:phosphate ABC transporter permease subunit PstC [Rhodospirillaceae bacterium]
MNVFLIIAIFLVFSAFAYRKGTQKALATAGRDGVAVLHSRPGYYGTYLALWCGLPAVLVLGLWMVLEPLIVQQVVIGSLPDDVRALGGDDFNLILTTIQILARGGPQPSNVQPYMVDAAARINDLAAIGRWAMFAVMLSVAIFGFAYAQRLIAPSLRARNRVEQVIKYLLIICSCVAIFTTIGIVLSVLFESLHFFSMVPPQDFFFHTVWDPGFPREDADNAANDFGLVPLLWGTIFISFIAMMVAGPIGLLAAVYLSEYARGQVRAVAKPLLEILAGIPTVVYGFFALVTVGPALRDFGLTVGLDIQASSALTAGLVMGIMIIPFVSSLSDDIISQVPRSLRDGSYGLGATRSETIKKVVFPAALPGIVGGLLLAVSRAFGETMIVVMAVGAAANLTANPFESVTTVTVMIVKQLTGDTEFGSPQTLVAFALGLTLFVITLCLNIIALYVVRKYREQYE